MLHGVPRSLNTFYPLATVILDEDSVDDEGIGISREASAEIVDVEVVERGLKYFENIYRGDMVPILEPMDRLFPGLRRFSLT